MNKKESLFKKKMRENPNIIDKSKGFPDVVNILHEIPCEEAIKTEEKRLKPKFLGVSEGEYEKIEKESNEILKKMTEKEIEENRKELLDTLDPKLLAFFQRNEQKIIKKEPFLRKIEEKKLEKFEKKFEEKKKEEKKYEKKIEKNEEKFEDEKENDYFFEVFFDNDGKEVEKPKNLEEIEEKFDVFVEKQEHSLDNLMNMLANYSTNVAISAFSLYKFEKILQNFYEKFKENGEILDFQTFEKSVFRINLIEYLMKNCDLFAILSNFLSFNNVTIKIHAIKTLKILLRIIIGKNFSLFLKRKTIIQKKTGFFPLKLFFFIFYEEFCELFKKCELFKRISRIFEEKTLKKANFADFIDVLSYILYIDSEKSLEINEEFLKKISFGFEEILKEKNMEKSHEILLKKFIKFILLLKVFS